METGNRVNIDQVDFSKKNIYQKLQSARVELSARCIKKSGKNEHQKYSYLELIDFSDDIQDIFNTVGLCGLINFSVEVATLTLVDNHKPDDKIVFSSPMAEAKLPGAHPIQNLGAVQTYQRRYLYMAAMEITAPDTVDSSKGATKEPNPEQKNNGVSPNPKDFLTDNRPWMNETQFKESMARIKAGETDLLPKIIKAMKMKKEYKSALESCKPENQDIPTDVEQAINNDLSF